MVANRDKVFLSMARACMDTKDLAKAANMPVQTVNRVLLGRGSRPSTIGRIAKALGVDPKDILDATAEKNAPSDVTNI